MTEAPLTLPEPLARRVRKEAEKLGMTGEEYLIELVIRGLGPPERARKELGKGDLRQAAEKLWGATALAVKAYATWREGWRLTSHRGLWEYKERLAADLGGWSREAWYAEPCDAYMLL